MKIFARFLALCLVLSLVLSAAPFYASAAAGERPADGETVGQPFGHDVGGSHYFRIPGLVVLDSGRIVASCDARWNHTGDGAGLDTIVSYSDDQGATWHYTFANYLGDNGNEKNVLSTSFIDPAIATDGKTLYMIADLFPAGIALNTSKFSPVAGKNGLDENGNLLLRAKGDLSIEDEQYAVKAAEAAYDFYADVAAGTICRIADNTVVEGYTVDAFFNITGTGVETNLFCADAPFQPYPTDYLYLTTSEDGAVWSEPELLNLKGEEEQTLLVGPGNGTYDAVNDRIIFTAYEHTSGFERACLIWMDKDGAWHRTADAVADADPAKKSSEATAVVLSDGTVRCFYRSWAKQLEYTDYVWDDAHGNYIPEKSEQIFDIIRTPNNQMSAFMASEKFYGRDLIFLSTATSTEPKPGTSFYPRTNGFIYAIAVNEDRSMDLVGAYDITPNENEDFNYACMAELEDEKLGLLWEGTVENFGGKVASEVMYSEFSMEDIIGSVPFADVTQDKWFYEEVMEAYYAGIIRGVSTTEFDPYGTTTRAMFVSMLYRMEGRPAVEGGIPFEDVAADAWYADSVAWAYAHHIVAGRSAVEFDPAGEITRQEAAAILYRLAQYKNLELDEQDSDLHEFKDADQISPWAYDAVDWAERADIIEGREEDLLDPRGIATRAEVSAFLVRFLDEFFD